MDYDATDIAVAYDRGRDHGPEFRSLWMNVVSSHVQVVTQEIAPNYGAYAEKLSAGADSVLARLSSSDFEAGIRALRLHAARVDSQAVFESIDVFVFR